MSVTGKISVKIWWRPCISRLAGGTSAWRKSSYDLIWTSRKLGMSVASGMDAKFLRVITPDRAKAIPSYKYRTPRQNGAFPLWAVSAGNLFTTSGDPVIYFIVLPPRIERWGATNAVNQPTQTKKRGNKNSYLPCTIEPTGYPIGSRPVRLNDLLDLDSRADFFELRLGRFGFLLGDTLFEFGAGRRPRGPWLPSGPGWSVHARP